MVSIGLDDVSHSLRSDHRQSPSDKLLEGGLREDLLIQNEQLAEVFLYRCEEELSRVELTRVSRQLNRYEVTFDLCSTSATCVGTMTVKYEERFLLQSGSAALHNLPEEPLKAVLVRRAALDHVHRL